MQRRGVRRSPLPSIPEAGGHEGSRPWRNDPALRGLPRRRRRSLLSWFLSVLAILLLVLVGFVLFVSHRYSGRIFPNIAVNGADISQKTPDEARPILEDQLQSFLSDPVTLTYGDRRWQPTLSELGVVVDIDGSVARAYNIGRSIDPLLNVEAVATVWRDGVNLPLQLIVDGPRLRRYLESITAAIGKPAYDAELIIEQSSARLVSSREGRLVLLDATMKDLLAALQTLQHQDVAIRTELLLPHLHERNAAEAQATVNAILQSPITLQGRNRTWTLSLDDLRAMLRIERVSGGEGDRLQVSIDEIALRQRIAAIADEIGRGSVNPRLRWNNGAVSIIKPGQIGLRLDEEASYATVRQGLTGENRTIELVVQELQPQVNAANLNSLGIQEIVGVGKSSFKGSAPYRITNIRAGSQLLDGTLIAPGEEFSFNKTIGSIDARNGFVEGYAIVGNRTQLEFGGGICQDSTTLFRAAFHAGLPITERHEHSFRISWYEHFEPYGMDAAIYTGQLDLRFVNDTGHWLLLQTYMNEKKQELTYVLYGTKPNREVIRSKPIVTERIPAPRQPLYVADRSIPVGKFKQTDVARDGMTITIYRIIKQNGVVIKREPFVTHFKAWPNVFLHHPKTPLPPPGCLPGRRCR